MTEYSSSENLRQRKAKLKSQKISAKVLQPFQKKLSFIENLDPDTIMHEAMVTTVQTEVSTIVATAVRSLVNILKTASVSVVKRSESVISVLR